MARFTDQTEYTSPVIASTSTVKHLVKNGSGVTLTKGTPVYVTGSTGNDGTNMLVAAAASSSEATSSKTLGLLETTLAPNGIGYVITEGLLAGLNTNSANVGDPIWLGSTAGTVIYGLVAKPHAPQHLVYLGVVTRKQTNNGEYFVKVQNGYELEELHNIIITNPQPGDVIKFNGSNWVNQQP